MVAVRLLGKNKWANYYWECICDCGKYSNVASRNLKAGRTKSCGCLVPNCFKKTHGMTDTHFYYVWQSMLYRTRNKDARFYEYYGGRGISVCKRWLNFESFKKDMYESYLQHCKAFGRSNTSIDRINNDRGYRLSNCRWATRQEQNRNKRKRYSVKLKNNETPS